MDPRPLMAVDPGAARSGWVWVRPDGVVAAHGDDDNLMVRDLLREWGSDVVIEYTKPRGQPASMALFDTLMWTGRFIEAAGREVILILGSEVRRHLCGNPSAKDAAVHTVLWDRFGGSMKGAKGTKDKPGPLYGFSGNDEYDALALAITYIDKKNEVKP